MSNKLLVYYVFKAESSGWLFVTTCTGRKDVVPAALKVAQLFLEEWKRSHD